MKVLITGSTGMVGKGALLECLESSIVESVLIVNRSTVGVTHPKLKEILHKDFFDLSSIEREFKGYDACFFCMGVSAFGLDEKQYHHLTFDLVSNFAKTFVQLNPNSTFCYVSGEGTDSSEKGALMWARVKGKTENALMKMPFKNSFMFRPGYIQPMKGVKTKVKLYALFYVFLKPLYPILNKLFPSRITSSDRIGRAMINCVQNGYARSILEISDINRLAGKIECH